MAEDLGEFDVIVVGGGIAGASVAGELAEGARVLVLEREAQPAYHASGRSAAIYIEPYSTDPIFALTRATLPFLEAPPDGFSDQALVHDRGYLLLVTPELDHEMDEYFERWGARCPEIREIGEDDAVALLPVLRRGYASRFAFDPTAVGLDTNEMVQGWLRRVRRTGGVFMGGAEVTAASFDDGRWRVASSAGDARAPVLVNAAGAWARDFGRLAGGRDVPLVPHRRSAVLVAPPDGIDISAWPAVSPVTKRFYFKPEGGHLMISPADQTPSEPMDAWPEDMDLAIAVERAEEAAELKVRRFESSWAGLRTFVPDENPVYGWDPELTGFYWCAGQGGVGFQTSWAGARWCAAEIGVGAPPASLAALGFDGSTVAPDRFR
ncbi:MAG: FAD-dependent oxidoreductase [Pseudomonadales bacterium]|jgi:D-arginine dehydrogenase|nr:FAD-dependent oxidoreductase [Pseudomonadales bacterium]